MQTKTIKVKRGDMEWEIEIPAPKSIAETFGSAKCEAAAKEAFTREYSNYVGRCMKRGDEEDKVQAAIQDFTWHPFSEVRDKPKQMALEFYELTDAEQDSFAEEIHALRAKDNPQPPAAPALPAPPPAPPMQHVDGVPPVSAHEKAMMMGALPAQGVASNPQARTAQRMASNAPPQAGPQPVLQTDTLGNPIYGLPVPPPAQLPPGPQPPLTTPLAPPPVQTIP